MTNTSTTTIYQRVTDSIVRALEQGNVGEWKRPWNFTAGDAFSPLNVLSRKPYRGINPLILWSQAQAKNYTSGEWGTLRQWNEKDASVKKGEKATAVVLWKFAKDGKGKGGEAEGGEEESTGRDRLCFVNYYNVFNAAQVSGYVPRTETETISEKQRIKSAEQFFETVGAKLKHGGNQAFYHRTRDEITLPKFQQFRSPDDYYSTSAHEHIHWSGAEHRLDRTKGKRFGDNAYAVEELIAELGAAMVMADLRMSSVPRADHTEYIKTWLSVLKSDSRAIFTAASQAQKAADFLMVKAGRREAQQEAA